MHATKKLLAYPLIAIITILTLFGYYLLTLSSTSAADPIPAPHVPCDSTEETEFNSLRPYQASPCDPNVYESSGGIAYANRLYCGNDLITVEYIKATQAGPQGCVTGTEQVSCDANNNCNFKCDRKVSIEMNFDDSQLPVAGQTELVPNSESYEDYLDSGLRMSEYISWYLNGVINRAEDPFLDMTDEDDIEKVTSYSGPINKLLPWFVQTVKRQQQVSEFAGRDPETSENARHNQTAGCTLGTTIFGFGVGNFPIPCYWIQLTSLPNNNVIDEWQRIPNDPVDLRQERKLSEWKDGEEQPVLIHERPDNDKGYENFEEYWDAYLAWSGQQCIEFPFPFFGNMLPKLCFDTPFRVNWPSALYPYIPYSSTEDRKGDLAAGFPTHNDKGEPTGTVFGDPIGPARLANQPNESEGNEVRITSISFNNEGVVDGGMETLFFPHMKENTELLKILQDTYLFIGEDGNTDGTPLSGDGTDYNKLLEDWPPYDTNRCDLLDVRWNPGDDLFGEVEAGNIGAPGRTRGDITEDANGPIQGELTYSVEFDCNLTPTPENPNPECEKKALTATSLYIRMPLADETWGRSVAGSQSIFQRIYPKLGEAGMFEEIKDFPVVTGANYSSSADETLAGEPGSNRPGGRAEIFFPHLGGVLEYFLYGIQDALRPEFAKTSFPPGYPPEGGGTVGSCSVGSGYCDPNDLADKIAMQDTDGNYCGIKEGNIASQLCQRESNSDPNVPVNDACVDGITYDYSVGLFQFNMLPIRYYEDDNFTLRELRENWCPGAFVTDVNIINALNLNNPSGPNFCRVKSQAVLDECVARFQNPEENVRKAVLRAGCESVPNGTCNCDWSPWASSTNSCGIQ